MPNRGNGVHVSSTHSVEGDNMNENADSERDMQNQSLLDLDIPPLRQNTEIMDVRNIKLPAFWIRNPTLWFAQVDAQFHKKRVTSDNSKYYAVIAMLDSNILEKVSDLIESPPQADKYQSLKTALINRFTDSQQKQLHLLVTDLELGDKTPSQLLREMRTLAAGSLSEEALRTLWLQRIPVTVRCVLSASKDVEIAKLADIADRIVEASSHSHIMAIQPSTNKGVGPTIPRNTKDNDRITELESKVSELTTLLKEKFAISDDSSNQTNHRSRSRTRSSSRSKNPDICYYHRRFSPAAKKCQDPCVFKQPPPAEN